MYKNKKVLAIIPARSGSKGIPEKNIKRFAGKPLIYWTIKSAENSKYVDNIIVSTDSEKIAKISEKFGAEIPFLRPKNLATDNASSIKTITHALNFLEKRKQIFDIIILLQPTSPLRNSSDIDNSIKLLFRKKADSIISVTEAFVSPLWMNTLPEDECMKNFLKREFTSKIRQKLPIFFQLNGAVFTGFTKAIKRTKSFYNKKTYAYKMPKERSIDIDDALDFKIAEDLIKNLPGIKRSCK